MEVFKAVRLILILFSVNIVFCWVITTHWIFGPIVTGATFMGVMLLLGLLGMSGVDEELL